MTGLVLVTGAGGKTGRAVIDRLLARDVPVRAWVRSEQHAQGLPQHPKLQAITGDMLQPRDWTRALAQADCVYHIPPNMHPAEHEMGRLGLRTAAASSRPRFIFHSVLHPQTISMPHHRRKLLVETDLIDSGLAFTIVQPAAYIQNLLPALKQAARSGTYRPPYPARTRINVVDLHDVAEASAAVITAGRYQGAILELAGPENPTQDDVARAMAAASKRTVAVEPQSPVEWADAARRAGMPEARVADFKAMFEYYAERDFLGNDAVLEMILGRPPRRLAPVLAGLLDRDNRSSAGEPGTVGTRKEA